MTCSIFIALMTKSCWPARTRSPSATSTLTMVPCIGAATTPAASSSGSADRRIEERRPRASRASCRARAPRAGHWGRPSTPASARSCAPRNPPPPRRRPTRSRAAARRSPRQRRELRDPLLDEPRVDARPAAKSGCSSRRSSNSNVGRHSLDAELAQRPRRLARRRREVARRRVRDQLREQRVEARIGAVAGVAEGVGAQARPRWAARTRSACRPTGARCRRPPSSPC